MFYKAKAKKQNTSEQEKKRLDTANYVSGQIWLLRMIKHHMHVACRFMCFAVQI